MAEPKFTVTLQQIVDEFKLEVLHSPCDLQTVLISENDLTRPGLQLMGFYEYFNPDRIQVIGKMEFAYLSTIPKRERYERLERLFKERIKALCITRGQHCFGEVLTLAQEYGIPVLRTGESTSHFTTAVINFLNLHLAPRLTRHAGLVEIYGEGIMIVGDSGVGKSETAIELVKRGHRLVSDDAVEIRKVSNNSLVGTAPDNIRYFLELRGIGIINVRSLFGMGSVKDSQEIHMVVKLVNWGDTYIPNDRMGINDEYTSILGVNVPTLTIPVKPGRNTAVILEVAAMYSRQKKLGYDSTAELMNQIGMLDGSGDVIVREFDEFIYK